MSPEPIRLITESQENKFRTWSRLRIQSFNAQAFQVAPHSNHQTWNRVLRPIIAFSLALDCGMRLTEIAELKWKGVIFYSLTPSVIQVEGMSQTKHHSRKIPIDIDLAQLLGIGRAGLCQSPCFTDECFVLGARNSANGPSSRSVARWIKESANLAFGIPINPHMLRHTFASRMLDYCDLKTLQALLGHSSLQSTERYLHITQAHLDNAVAARRSARIESGDVHAKSQSLKLAR